MLWDLIFAAIMAFIWSLAFTAVVIVSWRRWEGVAEAPVLDVVVSLMTWVPWAFALCWGGWTELLGCVVGQYVALQAFCWVHERACPPSGPTIREALNQVSSPFRNHLGLFITLPALPIFLLIRLGEIVLYPPLVWAIHFPRYRHGDWVNVSRQKFEGLVGHDLVWCLYCDWMTGVYSFGAEILRNIESFWCPIRFNPWAKCENCRQDFPDLDKWAPPDASMEDVTDLIVKYYPAKKGPEMSWWGHPDREEE